MSQYYDLQDFNLWSEGTDAIVNWNSPEGGTYRLDPAEAVPGEWLVVNDDAGLPVMAFLHEPGSDGTLVLSIDGAITNRALLVHHEDDFPRKYYYATDAGNNNELGRRAFILRAEGIEGSPVARNAGLRVLCLRDKAMPFEAAQHQGAGTKTGSRNYVAIDDFPAIDVELKQERQALVTLTVPETWNTVGGRRNWFAITVDQARVAEGVMTSPRAKARIPVTVTAVTTLDAGIHTFAPQWRVNGGEGVLGEKGQAILTVQLY